MRPAGDVSLALLKACAELATADRGPTLEELAAHAQVARGAACSTLKNLVRYEHLRIPRTRKVGYRNRPVAEYELVPSPHVRDSDVGIIPLTALLATWGR